MRCELGRSGPTTKPPAGSDATLRTYLDENCSRGRTAKRLHVDENTVAYRLRQAAELLARPLERRSLELRVALELADVVERTDTAPSRGTDRRTADATRWHGSDEAQLGQS
ncbi:hypothetical protein A5790_10540 [Mycobacterium sp. 852002-51152_SCH6134967]|nr:hypothetical protein A5790_10540 [Mycobacterium sp. 852002-51152_SCH6134967]